MNPACRVRSSRWKWYVSDLRIIAPFLGADMGHKYRIGQDVYYRPSIKYAAAPGIYKIIKTLPVESEDRLRYRIKSAAEMFERTADESELTSAASLSRTALQ